MGFSLSDLDPTKISVGGYKPFGRDNMFGFLPGGQYYSPFRSRKTPGAPGDPMAGPSAEEQAKIDAYYGHSKELGQQFREAKGSPEDVQRYYEEQSAPIESNFFQGANQVSSYLARQGLGSSGMNLGAHAQLETNRSALEGQAKKVAIDEAIQKERSGILGQLQSETAGVEGTLQKYGIDTSKAIAQMQMQMQMEMLQQQMEAQQLGSLGSLAGMGLGFMAGGPLGGMAGAKLGSGLGGGYTMGGMGPSVPGLEDLSRTG